MSTEGLTVERRGTALVLRLASGASNPLDAGARVRLIEAVTRADCSRIVLAGSGATFSSAVPLAPDTASPDLADLCAAVEEAAVPVVAALHGLVLGPGAELALAARARVAAPGTRIAFPEVALGLCPAGGTSRRLPRLIGAAAALDLLLSGRAVSVAAALNLGLVDAEADDPVAAALSLALPAALLPRPATATLTAVAEARRSQAMALPAVARIIACVEASALLPPEAHRAFEAVTREDLESSADCRALRAVVAAERRATILPPAVARQRPQPVETIALHGAAPPLVTLARLALAQGMTVCWCHPSDAARQASLAALDRAEAADQRAGRMTVEARSAQRKRLQDTVAPVSAAWVQIHAGPPDPGFLQPASGQVHLVLDGTEGELGLALAPSLRVCELAALAEETPEAIALAVAALRRIGMPPVMVGARPVLGRRLGAAGDAALAALARSGVPQRLLAEALEGFGARLPFGLPEAEGPVRQMPPDEIVNRWLAALANEALRLLDQGIAQRPSDVDHLMVAGYGFPRWRGGPMHQAEERGLMVLRRDLRSWSRDHPVWTPAPLIDRLIQDGLRLSVLDG